MTVPFQYNPWISNANMQTIWPNYFRKQPRLSLDSRRISLSDGDFLDLCLVNTPQGISESKGLVFILHGLGGSINSHYVRSLMYAMQRNHFEPIFLSFRGASGVPNKKPFSYHAGKADDVAFTIDLILQENPFKKIFAIGISIGGSILINYLGNYKIKNPLTGAVAVSVPYDLYETAMFLNRGFSKNYQRYIMNSLKQDLKTKFKHIDCPIDLDKALNQNNLYDFDDVATAPLNNFNGARDYYEQCSAKQYLKNIEVPTLLIHAKDDPFMPATSIPTENNFSEFVNLELYEKGGHVGFIEGKTPWQPTYYLDRRIPSYFDSLF